MPRARLGFAHVTSLVLFILMLGAVSQAAPFTPGNIVVYRVGDGVATLVNTGNAVFLDEYTPDGTLVQSVALPTTASGSNNQLIASGTAGSEGLLTRSANGQYLLLTGYARNLGGSSSLPGTTASAVPRTVGRVKFDASIDTATALSDFASANNPRSAASTDGLDIWVGGAAGGVRYTRYSAFGSTTSTQLSTASTNIEQVNIFDGQLYMSTQKNTLRVATVGSGTPTASGQTITNLPGFPTTGNPDAFFFADLDGSPGVDTLYVADESASGGEIQKYSLVGGSWTAKGAIAAANVHGVTGVVDGATVTLYATDSGVAGISGTLSVFTDNTGYNAAVSGTVSALVSAPANEAFRGVALAPVSSLVSSPTPTATATLTSTPTVTATDTPVQAPTASPSATRTLTTTSTPTQLATITNTPTEGATATPSAAETPTSNTPTHSPSTTDTPTTPAAVTNTPTTSATPSEHGTAFTPGDIVVYRIGDGTATLTNNGNAVFLDEYTTSGSLVQSVALPTTAGGAQKQLIATADVSEGLLARSTDEQYILLTGFASDLGGSTALATTAATAVPRTVGRVKYDGTIDTSTALTDMSSANNVRSATSTNGTDIWVAGASGSSGGVHYTTLGSTTSTQLFSTIPKGTRQANIFGGQLYFDSNATGFLNVSAVGVGTPTTGGQTGTELPGLPDIAGNDGYFFADLGDGHGLVSLYVANDSLGEILKYALVSGSWTASGTITAAGVHGVTGVVSEGTVTLYATGTTGTDGTLYTFTDSTGFNGSVSGSATTLVTAASNQAFRGVTLAPVAPAMLTPTVTTSPTPVPTATETAAPGSTATATPVHTPSATATPEQTPVATHTPAQVPTVTTTPTPIGADTPTRTVTVTPTPATSPLPTPIGTAFTPGDIVVYRIGDGVATLTNNGNAVFLDEYTTSGSLVQSVALPTTASGAQNQLIATSDVSEGLLAGSTDGQYVLLTGFASNLGGSTALATTAATAVPRTVGRVKYDGTIDTSTALTDMSSANNVRSATSTNGTDIWVAGASGSSGGVHYTTLGSTTSTQLFSTIPKGTRQANIFGGQLYFDSNATGFLNVSAVGVGTPMTGGQTGTELPGLPDTAGNDGYFFADLGDGHGLATLYVANDTLGEILKYALVSGSWAASGTITAAGVHGVTGVVSGSIVTLYATGTSGTDGTLYTFTDSTGFNGSVSGSAATLVTAASNQAFRGVTLAPVAPAMLTPTVTTSPTPVPTATETAAPGSTATATPVHTPTATATPEQTPIATNTPTQVPTVTGTPTHTQTATATPTPTPTATETSLPTATAVPCVGDCNGSGDVTVNKLIAMVNIALGNAPLSACRAGDADGSGDITVNEILIAVNNTLNGCPVN